MAQLSPACSLVVLVDMHKLVSVSHGTDCAVSEYKIGQVGIKVAELLHFPTLNLYTIYIHFPTVNLYKGNKCLTIDDVLVKP